MNTSQTDSNRRSAVLTGSFYIVGTVAGILGLGVALGPIMAASDYLRAYGTMETRVLVASMLSLLMGLSLVAMAVAVYPVLRKFSPSAAVAYLSARIVEAVILIIGVVSMLALTELGKEYVASGAADPARFEPLGRVLAGVPEWAGHVVLDVAVFPIGALVLYWVFLRAGLVPRWLVVWGLISAALYWVAGVLVMFHLIVPLETPHIMLQASMGLQEMVLAVWLIAKGFSVPARAASASTKETGGPRSVLRPTSSAM